MLSPPQHDVMNLFFLCLLLGGGLEQITLFTLVSSFKQQLYLLESTLFLFCWELNEKAVSILNQRY